MTTNDREDLRRIAYGRDASAQERAAAEAALRTAARQAGQGSDPASATTDADADDSAAVEAESRERSVGDTNDEDRP